MSVKYSLPLRLGRELEEPPPVDLICSGSSGRRLPRFLVSVPVHGYSVNGIGQADNAFPALKVQNKKPSFYDRVHVFRVDLSHENIDVNRKGLGMSSMDSKALILNGVERR